MSFISPMLAASMPKVPITIAPGLFTAEEKIDGHRLVVQVSRSPIPVVAWSRNGNPRPLPPHLLAALAVFPAGIYDGELSVPGQRSFGVTELVNGPDLVYTMFDVMELLGASTMAQQQLARREYLEEIFSRSMFYSKAVTLATQTPLMNRDHMDALLRGIWACGGEGLILKRLTARYVPGKRPKDAWIKMKDLRTAILTIVGFLPSTGQIQNRGPYAMVRLRDDEGVETTVKTLNDVELRKFETERETVAFMESHPAIGRKLQIEYQERTTDGSYRHPRWDRWATE